jgi:hypothetical protein
MSEINKDRPSEVAVEASVTIVSEIENLLRRIDALPVLDSRGENEILGFAEDGLPH